MKSKTRFSEQIRRNAVALISLAIALTSLGYNTWRNEASEHNRNQRLVGIQILLLLGDLQQLTLDRHYGKNIDADAILRQGWAKVLTVKDLAQITEGNVRASADALWLTWDDNDMLLGTDVDAKDAVIDALERVRADTHDVLRSLD